MAATTTRTLELLSLLQSHRHWSARELVERLDVSERTLRRDVERLRELGLRHRVDARQRRRLPARGGHRAAAAAAHRRRGGRHRGRPALAGDGRACAAPSTPRSARSPRSSRCCRPRCAGASTRWRRTPRSASGARDAAGRPAPEVDTELLGLLALACRDSERLRFSYTDAAGESLVARRRALPARARRPPLVPARVGPAARGLAHVPARPHQRRVPDARALRAATDDRRGGARARRDRRCAGAIAACARAWSIDLPKADLVEHLGWYGRDVVADGAGRCVWPLEADTVETLVMALMWVPRGRDLPGRGRARGARVPRPRRPSGSAQPRLPGRTDRRPVRSA